MTPRQDAYYLVHDRPGTSLEHTTRGFLLWYTRVTPTAHRWVDRKWFQLPMTMQHILPALDCLEFA